MYSTWKDIYRGYPAAVIEIIKENSIISGLVGLIGFVSAVVDIITLFIKLQNILSQESFTKDDPIDNISGITFAIIGHR
jgi:hypothetical protein